MNKVDTPQKNQEHQGATPMLKQYHSIKEKHQNCILFFRLGDFYEMFFEDAKVVSKELDLVLTSRGKTPSGKIPMCGFPHHAADNYIPKLIKAGYKVAICEQVEDPALAKGIVKRDITRIITSGTYIDENDSRARYLLCVYPHEKNVGISFIDPTTGTIQTNQYPFNPQQLTHLLSRLPIYECIYPQWADDNMQSLFNKPLIKSKNITLSPYSDWCFNPDIAKKSLCEHFAIHNLNCFGIEKLSCAVSSSGALLEYLKAMNKQPLKHVDKISLYADDDYVYISPAAHLGLELESLIKALDDTLTPMGRRNFRIWCYHPLKNISMIQTRQRAMRLLKEDAQIQKELRMLFNKIPDIEKNISRLSCGYTHAKDLLAIRNTLNLIPEVINIIAPLQQQNPLFALKDIPGLRTLLSLAISEDIPLSHPEGKIIATGYHAELDELRSIQNTGRQWLKEFQQEEIKRTGINSLKVGYNKVFGYYLEVTKTNLKNVPEYFIRKQTLVNAERFITPELKEYEEKILTAQDKIIKIENALVDELKKEILKHSIDLHAFCRNIADMDCLYSLSVLAGSLGYTVPVVDESPLLDIKNGRHPIVEKFSEIDFIPNDTLLNCEEDHLIILTGPNMAGKSTYIRQTAILVMLAQMGSAIPAESATIGIVDKIFTRIGAHDDISKGQSTFMVEMNETADILNNMTDQSLVILDEIGRGTSTYDGLSLAWALAEYFHHAKTRTLFATHFHELTALGEENTGVKNYNVAVKEWKDEIIFLHKIVPGGTDDSYGIYVAKLAGIPSKIIKRAKALLTKLELKNDLKEHLSKENHNAQSQLNFFSPTITTDEKAEDLKNALEKMDVNNLTPIEALNKLNELKKMIN